MNQTHYRELKQLCDEYGEYRKELVQYHSLLLRIAWFRLGKILVRELKIRKFLSFLVRVMEGKDV